MENLLNCIVLVVFVILVNCIWCSYGRISHTGDLPDNCAAKTYYSVVTEISDGNGFCPWLRSREPTPTDGKLPMRLAGIDAPEMRNSDMPEQFFAKESKECLKSFIQSKYIKMKVVGHYNTSMEFGAESQPSKKDEANFALVFVLILVIYLIWRFTRRISHTGDLPEDCAGMRIYGIVTGIPDGDGFSFFHCPWLRSRVYTSEDRSLRVRLAGIDAPEMGNSDMPEQFFAKESKEYLTGLIKDKYIKIKVVGVDQYNRVLAFAYLPGWFLNKIYFLESWFPKFFIDWLPIDFLYTNVNLKMIENGYACVYKGQDAEYDKYKDTLKSLEKEAKREKKGKWIKRNCLTPMEHKRIYRKRMS